MPLFPISLEVEEVAVGRVLRKLHALEGVARIHLNLTREEVQPEPVAEVDISRLSAPMKRHLMRAQEPAKFRKDGRINTKGVPIAQNAAYRAIAEVLNKTPAHNKVLQIALERIGVTTKNAVHGYVHRLTGMKLIQRTAPGTYRLSPKGERTFFGTSSQPVTYGNRGGGWVVDNHKGVRKLLLDHLKSAVENDPESGGLVSSADITKIIADAGFSPKNLSTTGIKMRHEGLIEYEDGFYSITEAGVAAIQTPSPEAENISQSSDEGLTANG